MLKDTKTKTEYITSKDLAEQTKTILEAVDFSLQKYHKKTNTRFNAMDARFNAMDARFDKLESESTLTMYKP